MTLDPRTSRMIRDLAKTQDDLKRQVARLNRGQDAGRTTIHHGALQVADRDGKVTHKLGQKGLDPVAGPVPPRPATPALTAGQAQIVVATDGDDVDGNSAPADWAKTRIYATTQPPLAANPAHAKGSITEVDGETTLGVHAGVWHVGIVWETESGQVSELSETVEVEVEPPVDAQDIEDTLAEAEQIIADAVAVAQTQLDELRDRLDNFEEFDPSDLVAQINQVTEDLAAARQEATGMVADLADRVDDIKIPDVSGFITQAEVDAAAAAAETAAKEHADLVAQGAKDDAIAEAEAKATAAREAAEQAAKTYTDQQDIETLATAAADATTKADAARAAAEAEADRLAKAEAQAAQTEAIRQAKADALAQANAARDAAIESASTDATAKAEAAQAAAEEYAEAEAQAKADAAQAEAIRQAAEDATAKANKAREDAEAAANDYADQQDAQVKIDAALDAQEKADAAQSAAHQELTEYISGGANLLYNGSFEHGWDGWSATGGEIIESDDAYAGSHVVLIGSTGANQYPRHDWIATEKGRVYLVEFWVKKLPGGNDPRYVRSYYQVTHRDGTTVGGYAWSLDQSSTYLAYTENLPENEWVKLTALQEISFDNAESVRFSPHFYRTGTQFHLDSVRVVDVTEAKTALDAAEAAQARADEAHANAGAAWSHADAAMTRAVTEAKAAKQHADNLPKMLGGTGGPVGTAPNGSVWFRRDSNNTVIGRWERINGSWVQQEVSGEIIDNLEAGKITALNTEFAESVIGKLWTQLAIVDRLIATSAWIGGAMIGEDAVEAKHITASESLSGKVAEFLKLSVADLIAGSAEIDEAVVEKFWAAFGVFDRLTAAGAWVTGDLVVGDTIRTRHLHVTREMVGEFAKFMHLVVDQMDVNQLWADQTWQNAGYFGAEGGGFRTTVNGQGVLTEQEADGEYLPASQLGGPEQSLTFWDENQEPTATVERSGDASFQLVDAARFEHQGRPVFDPDCYTWHDGPLLDALPRGIVDRTPPVDMAGVVVNNRTNYGFLEVAGRIEAGRVYRVSHTPFMMRGSVLYNGGYTYTFSNTTTPPEAPHTSSERLENIWWRITQEANGEVIFTAPETGIIRILLVVERASSGEGIEFITTTSYARPALVLEDIGPARRWNGRRRYAAHGGSQVPDRDPVPLIQGYTTAWTPSWQQVFRGTNYNGTHYTHGTSSAIQGHHNGYYHASMLGGYQTNPATRGDHAGQTMRQALNGRRVISGRIIVTGTSQNQTGLTNFYWHAHGQPPTTLRVDAQPPNHTASRRDRAGTTRVSQLPDHAIDAINQGILEGITIHPVQANGIRDTRPYHGVGGVTHDQPVTIELSYEDVE